MPLHTDQRRNGRTRLLSTLRNTGDRADSSASHALHALWPIPARSAHGSHPVAQPAVGKAQVVKA
jgi:hypothetical protein